MVLLAIGIMILVELLLIKIFKKRNEELRK